MLAQDGSGMVRDGQNFLEGPATADGGLTPSETSFSGEGNGIDGDDAEASPLHDPEFDKSNSAHALPSPLGETSSSGEGNGNDAAMNGVPALQDGNSNLTAKEVEDEKKATLEYWDKKLADRNSSQDKFTPEQVEKIKAAFQVVRVVDDATPLQNFCSRLEELLTGNGPACYIIGEFGGEFFVRLQRPPDPTLAGHGRTITEALSSLLDCAQAEQTAVGLAKAGEF